MHFRNFLNKFFKRFSKSVPPEKNPGYAHDHTADYAENPRKMGKEELQEDNSFFSCPRTKFTNRGLSGQF